MEPTAPSYGPLHISRFKYVIGIGVGAGAYVLAKFAVSLGLRWAVLELLVPAVSPGHGEEHELIPPGSLCCCKGSWRVWGPRTAVPRLQWLGSLAIGLTLLPGQGHISSMQCLCSGSDGGLPRAHLPSPLSLSPLAHCSSSSPTWSKGWSL